MYAEMTNAGSEAPPLINAEPQPGKSGKTSTYTGAVTGRMAELPECPTADFRGWGAT
jgi:hypothetical protein